MRRSLAAITSELQRLKAEGNRTVSIPAESVALLRWAMAKWAPSAAAGPSPVPASAGAPVPVPAPVAKVPAVAVPKIESKLPPSPVVTLPAGDKLARWAALRERVLSDPTCRENVRPGCQVVFGVGNIDARIMFVGEAPGAEEEQQGEPFVGPAGQLLTNMIAGMGLARGDVYIGNIMNWRPQIPTPPGGVQYGNRPPTAAEMAYCLPYLVAQIEVVAPELVVALGATAAQGLLGAGTFRTLGEVRGRWHMFAGKPLMVTYHPSYVLRTPTNQNKRLIWEDLLKVMEKTGIPVSDKQRGYFLGK
jgi:uracil-DNA glycosylase family 4